MSDSVGKVGQIIELVPFPSGQASSQGTVLAKTGNVEIVELVIPQGRDVPTHEFQGEAIVHCLQGRVRLLAPGDARELHEGQLIFFSANEPFSLRAVEDALLLVTIVAAKTGWNLSVIGE